MAETDYSSGNYNFDFSLLEANNDEVDEDLLSEDADGILDIDTDEDEKETDNSSLFGDLDNSITTLNKSVATLNNSVEDVWNTVNSIDTSVNQAVTVTTNGTFFHTQTTPNYLPYNDALIHVTNEGMNLGYYISNSSTDEKFYASNSNTKNFTTLASYNKNGVVRTAPSSGEKLEMVGSGIQLSSASNTLSLTSKGLIATTISGNELDLTGDGISITSSSSSSTGTLKISKDGIKLNHGGVDSITVKGDSISFSNGVKFGASSTDGLFYVGGNIPKSYTFKAGETKTTVTFTYKQLGGGNLSSTDYPDIVNDYTTYIEPGNLKPIAPVRIDTTFNGYIKIAGWNYNPGIGVNDTGNALTVSLTRQGAPTGSKLTCTLTVQTLWVRADITAAGKADTTSSSTDSEDTPTTSEAYYPLYGSYNTTSGRLSIYTGQSITTT